MIKKIIFISLFISFISVTKAQDAYLFATFREPQQDGLILAGSTDGYHWQSLGGPFNTPGVGTDKIMRDPSIAQGPDGTFYMVWTSSWTKDKGFGYASSKDLVHWTPSQYLEAMSYEPTTVNTWAPELFYDDVNKQFIIFWASTIPYRFEKGQETEDNNHRMYYCTTKDFKTFSKTKLFLDPKFSVIDCVLLKRARKDYVLILKDNTRPERDIKVAFAKSPLGPFTTPSAAITPHFTEGPTVTKVGNDYLIYFEFYKDKKYGAVKTRDFKTFTDATNEVTLPKGHKHGTIFTVSKAFYDLVLKNTSNK
jgi:hypothetical protein